MYDLFEFFASFLTKIENGDNLKDYPIVCTFIEDGQQRERFITWFDKEKYKVKWYRVGKHFKAWKSKVSILRRLDMKIAERNEEPQNSESDDDE